MVSLDTTIQASDSCTIFPHAQTCSWAETDEIMISGAHHEYEGKSRRLRRITFSGVIYPNIFVKVEILRRHVSSETNSQKEKELVNYTCMTLCLGTSTARDRRSQIIRLFDSD